MKKRTLSLQWKFLLGITLVIFPLISIIFVWSGVRQTKQAMEQAVNQARILARQVILTRRWVSDCGGVLVKKESKGTHQATYFPHDDLETKRGHFQRFTPSMVTSKLSQYSYKQNMYRFRLASLHPLNPKNGPDQFERLALGKFGNPGLKEMYQIERDGGREYLHYLVPLFMAKGCLKCHENQGYREGSIGGGLSIFLPVGKMKTALARDRVFLAGAGVGVVLLTILTLFFLLHRMVVRPVKELEAMTGHIAKGNFDARIDLSTGDEMEKLAHSFNSMAGELSRGRGLLEEEIQQATLDLSRANAELLTLDQLKSDFLANMSHELRSPLTVIRGGVDYLNRTIKGDKNRQYLEIIDKNVARLIRLVSDVFDFTRIEAGKADWTFEREDMAGLIQEVVEMTAPLGEKKDIRIQYDYPGPVFANMDLERIEQVLVNLIENAVKFSVQGAHITLELVEEPDTVLVKVRDLGVGIAEEHLKMIFEKFHTLPSSEENGKREGTGLGLAICKGIIEAHKGKIWAESEKGKGTTFFFRIPGAGASSVNGGSRAAQENY